MSTSPLPSTSTSTSNQILIKPTSTSTSNQIHQTEPQKKSSIKEHEIQSYNLTHQLLPHSNIYKLMKQSLPNEIKITNSSKTLIQSCVSEFLIFILSHSNSLLSNPSSKFTVVHHHHHKRKTINGLDLLNSFKELGFIGYFNVLKIYLIKYRSRF
ncbi:uncharacterized protein MELLADRAFT_93911 [Melampsora larici-populina 98AG31]|uniref:Transcription factor CBF/NF-Y/archaeal histone domain-containing protein n=1 Tax=Melampsora larici-populina (strain 98AG31 / pathotype 3-4-7) TaxID=747676 RepID=F4S5Q2_MELLP|nr:uncharacterized protein MELLADRAFT_93911 [Melampsora larici-populina 98AG31]EGG00069.1 hypothetical protein MELLADRAFT_93911 [Melampsora larici-populina 98AG31]